MKTQIVEIHKANVALLDGESLDQFSQILRGALQKKFGKPRSNNKPGIYVWPRAIFSDRAIIEKDEEGPGMTRGLWSVTYTRKDDGEFELGEPTKVREQLNFVPVSKAADDVVKLELKVDKAFWGGLPIVE